MNNRTGEGPVVSFPEFLEELRQELRFQQNGGTSYRKQTAQLSLQVAQKAGCIDPFFNRESAKRTVSQLLPDLDLFRIEDVAKMLNVIARELHMNATLSDEVRDYIHQKRQHRKPFLNKAK
ncbi:hypothetical protein NSQ51_10625 [Geobacillus sp. FSL K6-0789]|uniref:Uncharacterized protein n=1 Tax=Geobacillus stearothermophilus TaxID=1422 RepID=A0A3L7DAI1_GEOSE|nr:MULTISPECIES: hypothetical protein [Geobacillus]ASS86459.1 hypothetical protein GLN3_04600 [Geobacillus lituanicus]KMY59328.1 hypothetical protein AA906_08945 [Geobacillus stearothermophilus]KMY60096.1 hypothetical protein AA905_10955 [Geobacillus stearothermophilus]KMY60820.1 hypothetical protein AA904_08605 [Geobacillus stearothermophilus]MBR2516182.1 hypothetical protein [Geobacillus sp.]